MACSFSCTIVADSNRIVCVRLANEYVLQISMGTLSAIGLWLFSTDVNMILFVPLTDASRHSLYHLFMGIFLRREQDTLCTNN